MMLRRNDRILENIPIGALGIIALDGCKEMGSKVNDYIVKWRRDEGHAFKDDVVYNGYERDTYLIDAKVPPLWLRGSQGCSGRVCPRR